MNCSDFPFSFNKMAIRLLPEIEHNSMALCCLDPDVLHASLTVGTFFEKPNLTLFIAETM